MFDQIRIIGHGRVGSAFAARLAERGLVAPEPATGPALAKSGLLAPEPPAGIAAEGPDLVATRPALAGRGPAAPSSPTTPPPAERQLVVLCVPDSALAGVAAGIAPGPWIAHVSGATPLAALDPHVRRFGLHPLQTFVRSRGAEQLDGAWAAVTAETADARDRGRWLADALGLRPFDLADDQRALYHAGAAVASNYLVTLYRCAARLVAAAGAPPEALLPLMRRTMENGFELTGPIARGDWATVDAHLRAIREAAPDLERMYRALAEVTTA